MDTSKVRHQAHEYKNLAQFEPVIFLKTCSVGVCHLANPGLDLAQRMTINRLRNGPEALMKSATRESRT